METFDIERTCKWHKGKAECHEAIYCSFELWADGYSGAENPSNNYCESCHNVHHPPCCDHCCA